MMPLTLANAGEENTILKVGGVLKSKSISKISALWPGAR